MGAERRKLIILFCMHRSGSSLSASILEKLGMSLGPFELLGAKASNPHGHFEPMPVYRLNAKIQTWAFGFHGDMPEDPETLARFLDSKGAWPTDRAIPQEWLEEGARIARGFAEAGPITGIKEPRLVLTWPFWRRIFQEVENLEIVPMMLARSPHEIAMSMCIRAHGALPYWGALDVIGVNFARMLDIANEFPENPPVACFGAPRYWDDMRRLASRSGLTWDDEIVRRIYDDSSVHHLPATVAHPAQELFDELCGGGRTAIDPEANLVRLSEGMRRVETLMFARLHAKRTKLKTTLDKTRRVEKVLGVADPLFIAASRGKRLSKRIMLKIRGRDKDGEARSARAKSSL